MQKRIREEMTEQVIKSQQAMQNALQDQSADLEKSLGKQQESALRQVHESLDAILRDLFSIEDGQRLSSVESLKAGQAPLDTLLQEYKQVLEQLNLKAQDE